MSDDASRWNKIVYWGTERIKTFLLLPSAIKNKRTEVAGYLDVPFFAQPFYRLCIAGVDSFVVLVEALDVGLEIRGDLAGVHFENFLGPTAIGEQVEIELIVFYVFELLFSLDHVRRNIAVEFLAINDILNHAFYPYDLLLSHDLIQSLQELVLDAFVVVIDRK